MKKNYKKFIFIFLGIIFILTASHVSALEVNYNIPGLPNLTNDSGLPDYVRFIFALLTYLAGSIAAISFAIGAVQFAMSAASPSAAKEGKERMKGSIIGLILTVSAVIILRTINPAFTTPELTELPQTDGIYYTNGAKYASAPTSDPDVKNNGIAGFDKLKYVCSSGPAILVWIYTNKNLDYNGEVKVERAECGKEIDIKNAGSFEWFFETPGVYLCTGGCEDNMCLGNMTKAMTSNRNQLDSPFKGNVAGVRIVNNLDVLTANVYYQAVLHKEIGLENGGECSIPFFSTKSFSCTETKLPTFSIDISSVNFLTPHTSGNGVSFYNETYGWNPDKASGKIDITKEEINTGFIGDASKMYFDFSKVQSNAAFLCEMGNPSCSDLQKSGNLNEANSKTCCPCKSLKDCPGSIQIKGDYFVGLYSYPKDEQGKEFIYCQTFTGAKDVENLSKYKYVLPGVNLGKILITPIKQ